jgi:hypothetical protein
MKIWLVALLLFAPPLCRAQGNELVVEFSRANSLFGVGLDQQDVPFPKIAVYRIECGNGEFRGIIPPVILQQTQTDANGNFAFSRKDHNRTCLQVMTPGFDMLQVEVRYARSAGKLKLKLHVGA